MIKYVCDKCGKEITKYTDTFNRVSIKFPYPYDRMSSDVWRYFHLCKPCIDHLVEAVGLEVKEVEE